MGRVLLLHHGEEFIANSQANAGVVAAMAAYGYNADRWALENVDD
jgi:hypothetical protein